MLQILSVNPTGCFSYGYCQDIDLSNKGLVNLIGINQDKGGCSNGSGKTSLFNTICEVLFGENPTGEKGDTVINNIWGKGSCPRVVFQSWEGIPYRVTYCRKWKEDYYPVDTDNAVNYNGTGLFLDKYENGRWRDYRGNTMADTRSRVFAALGMTYSQFVSISYMSHRIGNAFLRGTNKEKIDILSGITGIEEWDKIAEKCRSEKKGYNSSITGVDQQIAFIQGNISSLNAQRDKLIAEDWGTKKREYEANLASYNESLTVIQNRSGEELLKLQKLEEDKRKLTEDNTLQALQTEVKSLELKIREVELEPYAEDPKDLDTVQELSNKVQQAVSQYSSLNGQLFIKERDGELLLQDKCPTCGAKISKAKKEKYEKSVEGIRSEVEVAEKEVAKSKEILEKFQNSVIQKKKDFQASKAPQIQEYQVLIEKKNEELSELYKQQQKYDPEIRECNINILNIQKQQDKLSQDINSIKYWIEQCDQNLKQIDEILGLIKQKEEEIVKLELQKKDSVSEILILDWLLQNIPYIKLHKLSMTMQELSDLTNANLSATGETIRVDITAFDAKKSKKTGADFTDILKSEIKVSIKDGSKEIPPRLYSEGETGLVSNAIVRALHGLAGKLGYGCNIILLDEIFAFIDSMNSQKLAQSFSMPDVGTVLITDNSGNVPNYVTFNESWIAEKKNGITTLTM